MTAKEPNKQLPTVLFTCNTEPEMFTLIVLRYIGICKQVALV